MKFETLTNKKKRVGISIGIISVISVIGITAFTLTRASYKQTQSVSLIKGNISYNKSDLEIVAIKLKDGSTYTDSDIVPTSGYILNTEETICKDKSGNKIETTFEYSNGIVNIGVTKKGTKCTLVFDKLLTAAEYLIAKNEMVNENGYRYEGKSPNNYVTFNNKLWRIIGVFDVKNTDTEKTESLVKIIYSGTLYDPWDKNSKDDWSKSSLMNYLNVDYLNSLTIESQNMIQSVKWNLGRAATANITSSEFYNAERGAEGYENNPIEWDGQIGLMYASDYGYASDSVSCPRTTKLTSYDSNGCYNTNWILNNHTDGLWTLNTSYSGVYWIYEDAYLGSCNSSGASYYSPTLYLKSNISILDNEKDGSQSKPYDLLLN